MPPPASQAQSSYSARTVNVFNININTPEDVESAKSLVKDLAAPARSGKTTNDRVLSGRVQKKSAPAAKTVAAPGAGEKGVGEKEGGESEEKESEEKERGERRKEKQRRKQKERRQRKAEEKRKEKEVDGGKEDVEKQDEGVGAPELLTSLIQNGRM